jgi:hypothetical protein
MITTIALIIGALALLCFAITCYAGYCAEQDEIAGQQIAERLSRYDYRSGTFML